MAGFAGPRTHTHSRAEPFRVGKRPKPKGKKYGGTNSIPNAKNSNSVNANAGIGSLKRRLRDLSRLLSKNPTLPADVKIGHEREIQALQHELVSLLVDKEKHEMIGKYHMVRFFERQKATRHLKKATKALEACEDSSQRPELEKRVHIAHVDLNYTQYYPHMVVYQSLWTKEKDEDGELHYVDNQQEADGAKGNVLMWRELEKAMKNGTLETLRDSLDEVRVEKIRKSLCSIGKSPSADIKAKHDQPVNIDDEQEDETGVGFFE
jgi:hypothetical protein